MSGIVANQTSTALMLTDGSRNFSGYWKSEQTTAPSISAGEGAWYVKSDGHPYFNSPELGELDLSSGVSGSGATDNLTLWASASALTNNTRFQYSTATDNDRIEVNDSVFTTIGPAKWIGYTATGSNGSTAVGFYAKNNNGGGSASAELRLDNDNSRTFIFKNPSGSLPNMTIEADVGGAQYLDIKTIGTSSGIRFTSGGTESIYLTQSGVNGIGSSFSGGTFPKNTWDIRGNSVIGSTWGGTVTLAGDVDLAVEGEVGIGVSTPLVGKGAPTINSTLSVERSDVGPVFIGRCSNAAVGQIPSIKLQAAGVAHGITDIVTTDTFLKLTANSGSNGGVLLEAFSDADVTPLTLQATVGDPTPNTSKGIVASVSAKSGTNRIGLATTDILMQWQTNTSGVATMTGDGRLLLGGSTLKPLSGLDVDGIGGVSVGNTYAGAVTAPTNGLIVEGAVAFGQLWASDTPESSTVLHIRDFVTNPFLSEKFTSNNSSYLNCALLRRSTTSGTMVDGFGPGIDFELEKNTTGGGIKIGKVGFQKDGADNSGAFVIHTYSTGSENERVRILSGGNMGLGTNDPQNKLDIEGACVVGAANSGSRTAPANGMLVQGITALGDGEGEVTAATGTTLRAVDITTGGAGNLAGADLTIGAGLGTGTGTRGTIIVQTPQVATAGDNLQTRATLITLGENTVTFANAKDIVFNSGTGTKIGTTTGEKMGFWGATPSAQPADTVALTDSSGGTANNTVAAVSGSGDDATINDNFADLTAKYNSLRSLLRTIGLMA